MSFFASVTFLLRNIIVTPYIEKLKCIKNDTKAVFKFKLYHP